MTKTVLCLAFLLIMGGCQSGSPGAALTPQRTAHDAARAQCDQVGLDVYQQARAIHGPALFVPYYGCLYETGLVTEVCETRILAVQSSNDDAVRCHTEILEQIGPPIGPYGPETNWRRMATESVLFEIRLGQICATMIESCLQLAAQIAELSCATRSEPPSSLSCVRPGHRDRVYWPLYLTPLIQERGEFRGREIKPLSELACAIVDALSQEYGVNVYSAGQSEAAQRVWLAAQCD